MSESELREILNRDILERLAFLEQRDAEREQEIEELRIWKETHTAQYTIDAPTLSVLRQISGFSKVMQWILAAAIGTLAAIGAIGAAFDYINKWTTK